MKNMLSRRLSIAFSLLIFVLICATAAGFYLNNMYTVMSNAQDNLRQLTNTAASRVDSQIRALDGISIALASNFRLIQEMESVDMYGVSDSQQTDINKILIGEFVSQNNIYSITVVTAGYHVFSTGAYTAAAGQIQMRLSQGDLKPLQDPGDSKKIILQPHLDFWNPSDAMAVISLMRSIKDGTRTIGFVEVEQQVSVLQSLCQTKWNNTDLGLLVFNEENEAFYSNMEQAQARPVIDAVVQNSLYYVNSVISTDKDVIAISELNYINWRTVLVLSKSVMFAPLQSMRTIFLPIVLSLTLLLVAFIYLLTKHITKPINRLVNKIQRIDLSTLTSFEREHTGNFETDVLSEAFCAMGLRLSEGLKREQKARDLQVRTLFYTLQSQIGPHFLFNTLGSIANLCEEDKPGDAADACYNLAELLRYSSNYSNSIVTLREETADLNIYLKLMKIRYRQRLQYSIDADPAADAWRVPKLTLQPLCENAIKYSLCELDEVVVKLKIAAANGLYIALEDNGCGFSEEIVSDINSRYNQYLETSASVSAEEDVHFGGMGLLSTLIRLRLHYGNRFTFALLRGEMGGALVSFAVADDK